MTETTEIIKEMIKDVMNNSSDAEGTGLAIARLFLHNLLAYVEPGETLCLHRGIANKIREMLVELSPKTEPASTTT